MTDDIAHSIAARHENGPAHQRRDDEATFRKWEGAKPGSITRCDEFGSPEQYGKPVGLDAVRAGAALMKEVHTVLTTNAHARKNTPVFSGCFAYFPLALAAVAALSQIGNEQHNPGTELHWDRSKSGDEWDALARHLLEVGTYDTDGVRHSAKVAWRALAGLQKELEHANLGGLPHSRPST